MNAQGLTGALGADATSIARDLAAGVVMVRTRGGFGAGTVWRPDGTIVTNHHVAPRETAEVAGRDGQFIPARAVARDEANDLAVLRADHPIGSPVSVGDARRLRPGELVLALGHPAGVRWAVSVGVVSIAPPDRPDERELIRSDVVLGPGNSGGPLADAHGRVVGINAMIGGGMGLAVPSHLVERLIGRGAEMPRPALGIAIRDVALGPTLRERVPGSADSGALILGVAPGSPADGVGLIPGDILVKLDGRPIRGAEDTQRAVSALAGGPLRLVILRGGVARDITVEPSRAERRAA